MFSVKTDKIKGWASKGSLAVIDQAFISGSNFLVSVLLARWSSPTEYGAFSVAFAVFLLLSQFQQSVLLEPMSVFGAIYSGSRLKRYYASLLHMQNGMLVAITVLLALVAVVTQHSAEGQQLGSALWGVTIASPFVLLFWMARRAFYLEHAPSPAAAGAVVYSLVTLAGLLVVRKMGALTSFNAFGVMGAAALVTSIAMFWTLRPDFRRDTADPEFPAECRQHWRYGSWALAGALAMWVPQNIFYAVLSASDSIAAAGDIRALLNFALPLQRMTVALGLLLLPYTARIHSEHGQRAAKEFTWKVCYLFAAGSMAYWAFILMFRGDLFHLLYGGKYSSLQSFLPWLAFSSVLNAVISAVIVALRAMRSPESVFYATGVSGVIALALGIPATYLWGVGGVLFSFIISNVGALAAAFWLMKRTVASTTKAPESDLKEQASFTFQTVPDANSP